MSAMTSERLAEIRRVQQANLSAGDAWPHMAAFRAMDDLLAHVDHLTADNARLREGIEALHGAERMYASCIRLTCDSEACQESTRDGERFHDDQPTGRVCLTCRYEDGEPRDWPCETAALLNPPTEGEPDHE